MDAGYCVAKVEWRCTRGDVLGEMYMYGDISECSSL